MKNIMIYKFVAVCLLSAVCEMAAGAGLGKTGLIQLKGGKINVNFNISLDSVSVNSNQSCILTPVIKANGGDQDCKLPPIIISGRNRSIIDSRMTASQLEERDGKAYARLNAKDAKGELSYSSEIEYRQWMDDAMLLMDREVTGCGCETDGEWTDTLSTPLLYSPEIILTDMQECPVTYVPRSEKRDAYLIYPVNKTVLYPDKYSNKAELKKIADALNLVSNNPDYEIQTIHITGWASPEGSLKHNIELANGRAEALKKHITANYNVNRNLMKVEPGGENWHELREFVEKSELAFRSLILNIIDTEKNLDQREQMIRQIDDGATYKYLLSTVYPALRKNTIDISYISKERSIEKARDMVFSNPSELNVHEFYNVADKYYKEDSTKYREVISIAADTYPDNAIANVNAAVMALRDNDLSQARKYLDRAVAEPTSWNCYGCLNYYEGNYSDAVTWWKKAASNGDATAVNNLKELEKRGY